MANVWYVASQAVVPEIQPLVVCLLLFTSMAILTTGARLYTRAFIIRRLGWDDWMMGAAACFSICFVVAVFFQIKYGLGQPEESRQIVMFLAAMYATVPNYNMAQTMYKLSLTFQASRLFTTDPARLFVRAILVWLVVCGVYTLFGALFYCYPVAKCWDDSLPGHCGNRSAMAYCWAAFNLLNDIIILVFPIPFLVRLQMRARPRLILLSVFACGFFTTITSIIRLKSLYESMSRPEDEQPVTGVGIALWSCIEINIAIITGSVPSLKPFVTRFLLGRRASSCRSSTEGGRFGGQQQQLRTTMTHGGNNKTGRNGRAQDSIDDDDELRALGIVLQQPAAAAAGAGAGSLKISVHSSIEMKSMAAEDLDDDDDDDDDGDNEAESERGLVMVPLSQLSRGAGTCETTIRGGGGGGSKAVPSSMSVVLQQDADGRSRRCSPV